MLPLVAAILTTRDEVEAWLTLPADEALVLQRPLPDGVLKIVATGVKEDVVAAALPHEPGRPG